MLTTSELFNLKQVSPLLQPLLTDEMPWRALKHSILLSEAKLPHCNYVGDSIVGHNVNLGAGVKVANFNTFDNTIKVGEQDTNLHKFGGAIGDDVSIGCNAVIAPGTLIGPRSVVYSGVIVSGIYSAESVIKHIPVQEVIAKHRSHHPG